MLSYIQSWLRRLFRGGTDDYGTSTDAPPVTVHPRAAAPVTIQQPAPIYNVGLDVGTSSTKIIVRDVVQTKRLPVVLRIGPAVGGYPAVGTPTTIGVTGGKAYFGDEAERLDSGALTLKSFKICVACQQGLVPCRRCPHQRRRAVPGRGGHFTVGTNGGNVECDAQDLFTLYVAWLRTSVSKLLRSDVGVDDRKHVIWNVCVPLAQMDDRTLAPVFCQMLAMSEVLEDDVESGVDFAAAVELVRDARGDFTDVTDLKDLAVSVVPETLAAMQGFIQRPESELGMYGLIDVGAGTTDVSFFNLHGRGERAVSFYGSGARSVGGDDFDLAVADEILADIGHAAGDPNMRHIVAARVRTARTARRRKVRCGDREFALTGDAIRVRESRVADEVWNAAHDVLAEAWRKLKYKPEVWKRLPLLLVGGGSKHPLVRQAFHRHLLGQTLEQPIVTLELSGGLAPGRGLSAGEVRREQDLLLVAEGLSHPEPSYPQSRMPSEVEALGKPQVVERFHWEDMYSK